MFLLKKNRERPRLFLSGSATVLVAFLMSAWFCDSVSAQRGLGVGGAATIWPSDAYKKTQNTYRSPEGAVKALVDALSANDAKKLYFVLGPKGQRLVFSDNAVDNNAVRDRFLQAYQEKNRIIKVSSKRAVLEIGNEDQPFPVPIEKVDGSWRFSGEHGRVELSKPPYQQK